MKRLGFIATHGYFCFFSSSFTDRDSPSFLLACWYQKGPNKVFIKLQLNYKVQQSSTVIVYYYKSRPLEFRYI